MSKYAGMKRQVSKMARKLNSVSRNTSVSVGVPANPSPWQKSIDPSNGGEIQFNPVSQVWESTANSSSSSIELQGWTHDLVFSSSDADTVAWGSGTVTMSDGTTTYAITGANTGNISAINYIYLDANVSVTALQTTTTASTAVGSKKILIAVAENNGTDDATFQVFGGKGGGLWKTSNLSSNTITANEIAANTITASEMNVSQLSAIAADLGAITAGTITLSGADNHIKSGQTAYDTGTGFWLGEVSGTAKFSIGDTNHALLWDGSQITLTGGATTQTMLDVVGSSITTGRLARFYSNSSDTSTRSMVGIINDNASSTNTRCLNIQEDGSGVALRISTWGQGVQITSKATAKAITVTADSQTTGAMIEFISNSSDSSTRNLTEIVNNHTSATGTTPLFIQQDARTTTNFKKYVQLAEQAVVSITVWGSDGTTPNGALSGAAGDVCFNGDSSKIYYCTGTTTWLETISSSTADTFTNKTFNANGTGNSLSNVDVDDLSNGTDGELITWDASGVPATVSVGTATHVLTSNGVGAAPTFQVASNVFQLLGSTTLSGAAASMKISSFSAKKNLMVLVNVEGLASSVNPEMRFNDDTGSTYGYKAVRNGTAADGASNTRIIMTQTTDTTPKYWSLHINNDASYVKRLTGTGVDNAVTASTPNELTLSAVWNNTAAQITTLEVYAGANFSIGSSLFIYGMD